MMKQSFGGKDKEDNSLPCKWTELLQNQNSLEDKNRRSISSVIDENNHQNNMTESRGQKIRKMKENTSKKFSVFRSQISGLCRKSFGQKQGRGGQYIAAQSQGVGDNVNTSPNGESQSPRNGLSALRNLEAVGSRMKNSRSLQNLETATLDSLRSVVERTGDLGFTARQRYGSHVDIVRGKYEQLDDCENENDVWDQSRWR